MINKKIYSMAFLALISAAVFVPSLWANGQKDSKVPGGGSTGGGLPDMKVLGGDISDALSQMDNAMAANDELTAEDEYYLGRAVAANILKKYKLYTAKPALTKYLNEICEALVINSARPVLFNGYHVEILDSQEVNAFATPGGHIFVTLGLIDCAASEDALAGVIAHEVGHIQLHHGIKIIENMRLSSDLIEASKRAATIASREASLKDRTLLFKADITEMVNTIMSDGYAQSQEFEADAHAVTLLKGAGYEPAGLIDMLKNLNTKQGAGTNGASGFSGTHPSPAARIANVQGSIRTAAGTNSVRQDRYKSFR